MFRIKPARNTTVAKQSNISPQHSISINFVLKKPQIPLPISKIKNIPQKVDLKVNVQITNKNNIGSNRLINLNSHKKDGKILNNHVKFQQKTLKNNKQKQHKTNLIKAQVSKQASTQNHKIKINLRHAELFQHNNQKKQEQVKLQNNSNSQTMIEKKNGKQLFERNQKNDNIQEDQKIALKMYQIQNNLQKKEQQKAIFQKQKAQEEELKYIRKQKQQNQQKQQKQKQQKEEYEQLEIQKKKQKQHQMLLQRIHKRRQARQNQKKKKLQIENKRKQNEQKAQSFIRGRQEGYDPNANANIPIGGMIRLNDQLQHFGMAEAIMDLQVNKLLKMKFDAYPNKSQIYIQIEQLDRINQSYLLVRDQQTNPLISGLRNFRLQIFNRIGNLIIEAQNQGFLNPNFHIIEANRHTNIPGINISRGLPVESHQELIKKIKVKQEQDCTICLHPLYQDDQGFQVKCGHIFHQNCIKQWVQNSANCPTCRYNIKFG